MVTWLSIHNLTRVVNTLQIKKLCVTIALPVLLTMTQRRCSCYMTASLCYDSMQHKWIYECIYFIFLQEVSNLRSGWVQILYSSSGSNSISLFFKFKFVFLLIYHSFSILLFFFVICSKSLGLVFLSNPYL